MPLTPTVRPMINGFKFGLIAGLWVLATELAYWHLQIPYPAPGDITLFSYYFLLFMTFGLTAGIVTIILPGSWEGFTAAVVGVISSFLMLALRMHDLTDAPIGDPLDFGLILYVMLVTTGVSWRVSRASEPLSRKAAPSVMLALCLPVFVLASKILVNTSEIQFKQPVLVALVGAALIPLLLAEIYRHITLDELFAPLVSTAIWLFPVFVISFSVWTTHSESGSRHQLPPYYAEISSDHPDIIWITVDTMRPDHMSVYGYKVRTTPNLEEFASGATLYTRCIAQAPGTTQSVPSMLSGTTPYRHGGVSRTRRLPESVFLLPEMLGELGYRTVAQSANPWVSRRYGMGQGFEEFRQYNTDNELFLYDLMKLATRLAPWDVFRWQEELPSFSYVPITDLLDETEDILLERDLERPFFLYLHTVDPHGPYQPPLRYVQADSDKFRKEDYVSYWDLLPGVTVNERQLEMLVALYDGEISYTDAELGRLFDFMREIKLFDRSLIVITSDHGEQFQDHDLWRHSNSLYQQLVHVPLLVKYPGQNEGKVVNNWVASIDIVPSILRQLGLDCDSCEGQPLKDTIDEEPEPIFTYMMDSEEIRPLKKGVVMNGWKLVRTVYENYTTDELFNIDIDPFDQNDSSEEYPEITNMLARLLDGYEAAAGPAIQSDVIELHPSEEERLRSLGYVE